MKIRNVTYCDNCGVETNYTKLCDKCNNHEHSKYNHFCYICDNDFPRTHLVYYDCVGGYVCDRCSEGLEE